MKAAKHMDSINKTLKTFIGDVAWYGATILTIAWSVAALLPALRQSNSPFLAGTGVLLIVLLLGVSFEGLRRQRGPIELARYILFPLLFLFFPIFGWLIQMDVLLASVLLASLLLFLLYPSIAAFFRDRGGNRWIPQLPIQNTVEPKIDREIRRAVQG